MAAQGSHLLNDNGPVLGLNVYDLGFAVGVLIVFSEILAPLGLGVLGLPAAGAVLVGLIPVRLRMRRKIIRDTIRSRLMKRVLYVPTKSA
jgi:hypothetical protein